MSDRKEKSSEANSNQRGTKKFSSENTLDEGVIAFGEWLMSAEDLSARCGPLSLRKMINDDEILLFDAMLNQDVIVKMIGGVPECGACHNDTECMHIGFSICVAQMNRRNAI
ncbi:hypothetical protein NTE_03456 [Candidatus Nitrososphaera evergladensis SR1]|uniref:Uncharacterized protein n=1 Tax=Candidatus Nitrososphaera evergladensis SR1 TaxID=1459636 RepID=A0A075N207_9ARCH|nr:hypothetical protein [Candidatus Nitrososphaera evergladensis]AIF85484.1 hypothetical protein NTE_03456 [Candidatus Nitrososphaera evergladensis SR1]